MRVLLSIKPEFASCIFSGIKRFEYRRTSFRRPVSRVLLYASAPVSMVVGEFEVEEVIHDDVPSLWRRTSDSAGISEDRFLKYFANKRAGYAIKIKSAKRYDAPIPLSRCYAAAPPQSFAYIEGD